MKTLILVRHAKSSWDNESLDDIDRPLNDRGKKDAPQMAKRLNDKKLKPDLFLSSPAKRAHKTAKYFIEECGGDKKDIVLENKLYAAAASTVYEVVSNLDDQYSSVVLFAHNPGLTEFVNTLTPVRVDNIPTCGVFAVAAESESWKDFLRSEKKFLFFDYPKNPLG